MGLKGSGWGWVRAGLRLSSAGRGGGRVAGERVRARAGAHLRAREGGAAQQREQRRRLRDPADGVELGVDHRPEVGEQQDGGERDQHSCSGIGLRLRIQA